MATLTRRQLTGLANADPPVMPGVVLSFQRVTGAIGSNSDVETAAQGAARRAVSDLAIEILKARLQQ